MTWELASTAMLALVLAVGFVWYERAPAARTHRRAGGGAGRAGGGRAARLRGGPQREAHHRHRAVRGLRARRRARVRGRRDHRAGVEHLPRPGAVDRVADGGVGRRRRGGRRPGEGIRRPRDRPVAVGDRVRGRGPGLRRAARPLPDHPRRAPGPGDLPGGVRHLAAVQLGACDRQRGLLPPDRPGLHPRAAPLPAPVRGALARRRSWLAAGDGRSALRRHRVRLSGRQGHELPGAGAEQRRRLRRPPRAGARTSSSPAGRRSGWPPPGATRATLRAMAAGRSSTVHARRQGDHRPGRAASARSWCSRRRASPRAATAGATWSPTCCAGSPATARGGPTSRTPRSGSSPCARAARRVARAPSRGAPATWSAARTPTAASASSATRRVRRRRHRRGAAGARRRRPAEAARPRASGSRYLRAAQNPDGGFGQMRGQAVERAVHRLGGAGPRGRAGGRGPWARTRCATSPGFSAATATSATRAPATRRRCG